MGSEPAGRGAPRPGAGPRVRISFAQAMGLILPYARSRLGSQIRSIWLLIAYLLLFQVLVLGIPILGAAAIAFGLAMVVLGLTFFLEGLVVGLMPLGELIGLKLPQRTGLAVILVFSLVMGFGMTLAEPALGALKALGGAVRVWDAPLLYTVINAHAGHLVAAIGAGVGLAVVFSMLRFLYGWSLKPFLHGLVLVLTGISAWAALDPNLLGFTGLAWDCGGIATGPVTVPLMLAVGIGVCRSVDSGGGRSVSGFGMVTLASLFPVLTVFLLGILLRPGVPPPMEETRFLAPDQRAGALVPFSGDEDALLRYAFAHARPEGITACFGGEEPRAAFVRRMAADPAGRARLFGGDEPHFADWVARHGSAEERTALFGTVEAARARLEAPAPPAPLDVAGLFLRGFRAAGQAIVPLAVLMLLVLFLVLRERLPRADEVVYGMVVAALGLALFTVGIEAGLSRIGEQVGGRLPAAFTAVRLEEARETLRNFDPEVVGQAVTPDGRREAFFFRKDGPRVEAVPYHEEDYDAASRTYTYVPQVGPLFGGEWSRWGIFVVLLFGFLLGYGATLAEPALDALGMKVEEFTVGTLRRMFLKQTVAVGVGVGVAFGVAKVVWDLPLVWLLAPPYLALLLLSRASSEEYVGIAWDAAGVTTGPVTIPLVLALGLGIGTRIGTGEGFGILAMASVYPILSVLLAGVWVARRRRRSIEASGVRAGPEAGETKP